MKPILLQWRASTPIDRAELDELAAALTIQVGQLRTAWPTVPDALVTADPAEAHAHHSVPWPVTVLDHSSAGLGVHLDTHGHPYAEVSVFGDWHVTASHEVLEMLVDPRGHRFVTAPSIRPSDGAALVSYLVEVGDPVEALTYDINGFGVSDFITPAWYDLHAAGPFDHLGRAPRALDVLPGGYVSWVGPDGHWHQLLPGGHFVRSTRPADTTGNARAHKEASTFESVPA